jgi:CheY-like chemotaxis protein
MDELQQDVVESVQTETITALVVEDDRDSAELMRRILRAAQIDATVVGNATEALAALQQSYPDLLIVDLALPGLNGFEFLEKAREIDAKIASIPAIAVTAFTEEFEPESAKAAKLIDDYLAKPIDALRFPEQVQRYAGISSMRARIGPCEICGRTRDPLMDVLTSGETSSLFSDQLSETVVRRAIYANRIEAMTSGRAWLLRYIEVAARWNNETLPPYRYWEGKACTVPCPECGRVGDPLKHVIAVTDDVVTAQGADFVKKIRTAASRREIPSRKSAGTWLILRSSLHAYDIDVPTLRDES